MTTYSYSHSYCTVAEIEKTTSMMSYRLLSSVASRIRDSFSFSHGWLEMIRPGLSDLGSHLNSVKNQDHKR